ncbi:hypothetical protein [Methanolobus vulcani]|uniref:Uncharacterized protein n=1 Tax=Methanolobus vulcani TaxID=38026 RepID=A0A7Z8P1E2_9EURY|nr:hypothetical protein [Methanolobus vulcani]TQD25873.1 hypothetical protein FKV42_06785 [Methanolobus vulcani]
MKFQKCFVILIILLLMLIPSANADVLFPGTKTYDRCVSISNISDYPDVVFVGYITGPVIQCENPYIINSSDCLTQFYKANTLTVYAIEKEYFDSIGLDDIDFESDPNILPYTFDFNVNWDYAVVANPLTKEERYYSVAGFNDTALILYEERRISFYGSVIDREETFNEPEIPSIRSVINESKGKVENNNSNDYGIELQEDSKLNKTEIDITSENRSSFKDSILCFIRKLFGNDC